METIILCIQLDLEKWSPSIKLQRSIIMDIKLILIILLKYSSMFF